MIRAIVTDIEGTTTDIRFVHNILFPYARERFPDFIVQHQNDKAVNEALDELRKEIEQPNANTEQLIEALLRFMDEDKKSTSLKTLQGIIWCEGYVKGDFTGHLYIDVLPAFLNWKAQNIDLYIYSSGSVDAQKLLFGYSDEGDLTPLFTGYFDTRVGAKREEQSYRNIADDIGIPATELLFLSDIYQELDAAKAAGWHTIQLIRNDADTISTHHQVHLFDEIKLEEIV
ncbi:enolase-phosphatase E1 [Providencia alcalifaciens]|nr:enolase-phosphatase E1 [Providencia alcalifaciens]